MQSRDDCEQPERWTLQCIWVPPWMLVRSLFPVTPIGYMMEDQEKVWGWGGPGVLDPNPQPHTIWGCCSSPPSPSPPTPLPLSGLSSAEIWRSVSLSPTCCSGQLWVPESELQGPLRLLRPRCHSTGSEPSRLLILALPPSWNPGRTSGNSEYLWAPGSPSVRWGWPRWSLWPSQPQGHWSYSLFLSSCSYCFDPMSPPHPTPRPVWDKARTACRVVFHKH